MHRQHAAGAHMQAGLLGELALRRGANVLLPLDVAAGDAPLAGVRAGPPAEQHGATPLHHHRHADYWIAEQHKAACRARRTGTATALAAADRGGADRAEAVLWRAGTASGD